MSNIIGCSLRIRRWQWISSNAFERESIVFFAEYWGDVLTPNLIRNSKLEIIENFNSEEINPVNLKNVEEEVKFNLKPKKTTGFNRYQIARNKPI